MEVSGVRGDEDSPRRCRTGGLDGRADGGRCGRRRHGRLACRGGVIDYLESLGADYVDQVDRVEAGVGVLVRESVTGPTGQALVAALPDGTTGGTVLTATVDGGAIRELRVDGGETARRRERAAGRLASLSRPLDDTR